MTPSIFKAYDIRGIYPSEIDEKVAAKIAESLAGYFKRGLPAGRQGKIVIAHDVRLSSPSLYQTILKSLKVKKFIKVIPAGMATTPMFYFLVNYLKAVGGIMVTASHNPKEYNGLKVVGKKAVPMSGKEVLRLMKL